MATKTAAARESRRKKILDRGADRLAFITGRTPTLPSESNGMLHPDSSQQLNSQLHHQDPPPDLSAQIAASPSGEDGKLSSIQQTNDSTIDAGHSENSIESSLYIHERSTETLRASASDGVSNEHSSSASSTDHKSTIPNSGTVQHLESQTCLNRFVTPSQISSAIAASERSRVFCSITFALLVVLSYMGFPLLGSNIINSIISFRPLYLVLLTNLTLVVARLLFNNGRGFGRVVAGEYSVPSTGKYDWAEQAGKALEVGLLMQKAIEAIFMDFSVYAVIVIAFFSFVQ